VEQYGCEANQIFQNIMARRPADHQILSSELPFVVRVLVEETCLALERDGIVVSDSEWPSRVRPVSELDWSKINRVVGLHMVERGFGANLRLARELEIEKVLGASVASSPVRPETALAWRKKLLELAREIRSEPATESRDAVVVRLDGVFTIVNEETDLSTFLSRQGSKRT
jgi:hypothetical protein